MPEPRSASRAPDAPPSPSLAGRTRGPIARGRWDGRLVGPPAQPPAASSATTARRHPRIWPRASARAGRACSSSSTRSRRPAWSAAGRCGTVSAGRATSTTSPTRPRTCSRPTTTAWPTACWPPSARSAARGWSTTCSRSAGGGPATESASAWPIACRPTRRSSTGPASWPSSRTSRAISPRP